MYGRLWSYYVAVVSNVASLLYRTKLSLSHALSQSVKISLVSMAGRDLCLVEMRLTSMRQFEELISNTIEETKDVPEEISETGKVNMSHKGAERRWQREKARD